MATHLLATLHIFAAITLLSAAVINFLVHPLNLRSGTISILLASLCTIIALQEISILVSPSRWTTSRVQILRSYLGRAILFLLAAAITFDRLVDLPCDIEVESSPYSTAASKFSVAPGGTTRNATDTAGSQSLTPEKGPPAFGTAFYLTNSLAPTCIKIDTIPDQIEGSVAWIHISANQISRALVFSTCACILSTSLIYFVLAILHRSGKIPLSQSMTDSFEQHDASHSLPQVQDNTHIFLHPGIKETGSTCRINLYPEEPTCFPSRSATDLYEENVPKPHRVDSSDVSSIRASSVPSSRQNAAASVLDPTSGAASTPEPIFRIQRIDSLPLSVRANSDPCPRSSRRDRYGYGNGCDRTVDFASGCIMHYPLFSQKKKHKDQQKQQGWVEPNVLLPPDFSRASIGSPIGLTPRTRTAKSRVSVSSRRTEGELQRHQEGEKRAEKGAGCALLIAVSETATPMRGGKILEAQRTQQATDAEQISPVIVEASDRILLSPSRIDSNEYPTLPHQHLKPSPHPQPRLGTAESACSNLSILSNLSHHHHHHHHQSYRPNSRPGTGQSTKSASSFRLMRRRRGLLATLDLHLGVSGARFSGISSHDVPTYDSQRSCSAGTFGDGVEDGPDASSPLPTPLAIGRVPLSPGPGSPAPR
ncbi:uncharacterized protein UTRI_03094_B [Ustilago trichophora]|uniref:Uncharacterized protein n=1 Tax=Ustilago trichophora TaxID=86804 RepID=A0A5C3E5W6_9BASI|nr:uncharacterized protein UTRI_03094_B [Ustilago trichophora]